jgi:hypothetical protein
MELQNVCTTKIPSRNANGVPGGVQLEDRDKSHNLTHKRLQHSNMNTLFLSALLAIVIAFACADTAVDLGDASGYALLAGSTITSAGAIGTVITGDIGIFPGTAVTGK